DPMPDNIELFMTWNQARELVANGISCQAHTVTHPILSRIDAAEIRWQLMQSRFDIERETGQPGIAFAYPNGTPADYNAASVSAIKEAGFRLSFTYTQGAIQVDHVQKCNLEIPRIHIGFRDTLEIYALKIT